MRIRLGQSLSSLFTFSFLALLTLGCGARTPEPVADVENMQQIQISSSAFAEGQPIPSKYTCDGENLSPPLDWSTIPPGAASLVLIADDPDSPGGTWVHWVVYNIASTLNSLPEGLVIYSGSQGTGLAGNNDFRKVGYGGPCPPRGKPHRYFFKLYALDIQLNLKPGAVKADVEKAMQGHILAQGQLMGKYTRK
jgi:Raf kinase inhibitor-like YbhB/YbcL family protein